MTMMIDEDILARLLEEAAVGGGAFKPPRNGADRILDAAIERTAASLESPLVRLRRLRAERSAPAPETDGEPHDGEPHDGEPDDGEPHDGEEHDGEEHDGEEHDGEGGGEEHVGGRGTDGRGAAVVDLRSRRPRPVSRGRRVIGVVAAVAAAGFLAFLIVPGPSSSNRPTQGVGSLALPARHVPTEPTVPSNGSASYGRAASAGSGAGGLRSASTGSGSVGAPSFGISSSSSAGPGAVKGLQNTSSAPGVLPGSIGSSAKVEQTGSLSLTVGRGDIQNAVNGLYGIAGAYGGFVASSDVQSAVAGVAPATATLTLQVPVAAFGTVLDDAKKLGRVGPSETHATDVTGQYVDLQARITAAKASLQQYLTIMTKANTIGDILAVQAQIDQIQSDIEQLQGQLQVLDSETTYSTLTVSVTEPALPVKQVPVKHHHKAPSPPESGISRAWHDSVSGFVSGVEWLIRDAGRTLFVLLFLGALFLLGRWGWRAGRRHAL